MALREGNSALQWAAIRPEDITPAMAVAVGHFVQVAKDLPTTPKRRRLLRSDHAPLGSCATLTPAIGIMRRGPLGTLQVSAHRTVARRSLRRIARLLSRSTSAP